MYPVVPQCFCGEIAAVSPPALHCRFARGGSPDARTLAILALRETPALSHSPAQR